MGPVALSVDQRLCFGQSLHQKFYVRKGLLCLSRTAGMQGYQRCQALTWRNPCRQPPFLGGPSWCSQWRLQAHIAWFMNLKLFCVDRQTPQNIYGLLNHPTHAGWCVTNPLPTHSSEKAGVQTLENALFFWSVEDLVQVFFSLSSITFSQRYIILLKWYFFSGYHSATPGKAAMGQTLPGQAAARLCPDLAYSETVQWQPCCWRKVTYW